jgi:hypothetical protein
VSEAEQTRTHKHLLIWGIALFGLVAISGSASCAIGYVAADVLSVPPPTPTSMPQPPSIHQVRRVGQQTSVQYALSTQVIGTPIPSHTGDTREPPQVLLVAHGEVIAGFDLGQLSSKDLWVDRTRIQLHLPAPKVLEVRLDDERSYALYYDQTWIVEHSPNLEDRTRAEAEQALLRAALEGQVLKHTSAYAELWFANWFYSLGFTDVRVIVN